MGTIPICRRLPMRARLLILAAISLGPFAACNPSSSIEDGDTIGPTITVAEGFVAASMIPLANGRVALIDANNDASGETLLAALDAQGYDPGDVTDIFITHGHSDHLGGITAFPGATVHGFSEDNDLIEANGPEGVAISAPLSDDDRIDLGPGLEVEVFHIPGHTPGSAAYLIGGVLLMGDAATAKEDGTIAPPPRFFSEDPDEAEAAIRRLADELEGRGGEIQWMVFSHSGPLAGADALFAF